MKLGVMWETVQGLSDTEKSSHVPLIVRGDNSLTGDSADTWATLGNLGAAYGTAKSGVGISR